MNACHDNKTLAPINAFSTHYKNTNSGPNPGFVTVNSWGRAAGLKKQPCFFWPTTWWFYICSVGQICPLFLQFILYVRCGATFRILHLCSPRIIREI